MAAKYEIFIVANADQAEAVMAKLGATMGATGAAADVGSPKILTLSERLKSMGPGGLVANSAISDLSATLTGRLGVASAAAGQGIASAESSIAGMGAGAGVAAIGIGALVAEMLISAEIVKKSSSAYLSWVEQVKKVSEVSGTTMQDASVLTESFKLLGVNSDTAAMALGRLGQNIGSGKFKQYAEDIRYAKDGSVDLTATLEVLADKFKFSTDVGARNAEMAKAFGRSWMEIVPILGLGADGIKKVSDAAAQRVPILTEEDKQKAIDYQFAMQSLSDSINKIWAEIGQNVVPALAHLADALSHGITNVDNFMKSNENLGKALRVVFDIANPLVGVYDLWNTAFPSTADGAAKASAAMDDQARAAAVLAQRMADVAAANTAAAQAATSFAQDDIAAQRASLSLAQTQASWQQKIADAASKKAADIATANKAIADSEKQLATVQAQTADTIKADKQKIVDATHALKDVEVADARTISDAKYAVGKAERDLVDVEQNAANSIVSAKNQILAAQERLRKDSETDVNAARRLADAKTALARTEQDIASGKLKGTDATRAYEDAETTLARAQDDSASAAADQAQKIAADQQAIADAQENLAQTQVTAAQNVADAQYRVSVAIRSEADAEMKAARDIVKARADIVAAKQAERADAIAGATAIANAEATVTAAVAQLAKARRDSGPTALEYKQHELDIQSATLNAALAHEKLSGDIATMVGHIADGTWNFNELKKRLDGLHLTQFPNLMRDLAGAAAQAGRLAANTARATQIALHAPDSAASADRRAAAAAASGGWQGGGGGSFSVDVNISAGNGVVMLDQQAQDALTQSVLTGLLRLQQSQPLGLNQR